MKKTELWMRDVQCWNVIFMLPVGENMDYIRNLIGLYNTLEYFLYVRTYIFGPKLELLALLLKMDQNILLNFLLLGNSLWFYDTHPILLWRVILPMTREHYKIFNHTMLSPPMVGVCVQKIG